MNIEWEEIPPEEVKAEAEAILESSGEANKIRKSLYENPAIAEWKNGIIKLIIEALGDRDLSEVTPDEMFDLIAERAHFILPSEIKEEVSGKIRHFIETDFENHI